MLVTDVGDEMCWRQLLDVGDDFGRFCHQYPLSFNISVGHQHSKPTVSKPTVGDQRRYSVTSIQKLSPR